MQQKWTECNCIPLHSLCFHGKCFSGAITSTAELSYIYQLDMHRIRILSHYLSHADVLLLLSECISKALHRNKILRKNIKFLDIFNILLLLRVAPFTLYLLHYFKLLFSSIYFFQTATSLQQSY